MNIKCRIIVFLKLLFLKIHYPRIVFRLLNKPEDLEKMYRLIWQVYCLERKYIKHEQFSPESLKDEYDENAIKIGAWIDDNLVGTLRIIMPSPKGFYVEKDFNVRLPEVPYTEMAEISRFVIAKGYRNGLISIGLLKKALEISKDKGIKYWIVVIPEEIKNHFAKKLCIKFYPIETQEPTEEHIKVREKMSNYYLICNPSPYLIKLMEI